MNILLTGGRAPATLELARAFWRAGHTVYSAESLPGSLSAASRAVHANFLVPAPRQHTGAFIQALRTIILENKIDLLIPTCEEVFYVSMGRVEFPCRVFVEALEPLEELHNKARFARLAAAHGLPVPETCLVEQAADLDAVFARWPALVLKPVYSRFAARTLIRPGLAQARAELARQPESAWVAQVFVPGRQICTYSLCHQGRITAHCAYPSDFTAGQGATVVFQHIDHALYG